MIIDNPVFNIKGEIGDTAMLIKVLELGFECTSQDKAVAYRLDKEKGLVLYWHPKSSRGYAVDRFVAPLSPKQIASQVEAFILSKYTHDMELHDSDAKLEDSDVENQLCWRVYTEDWGRINEDNYAFLAITPSFGWIGK